MGEKTFMIGGPFEDGQQVDPGSPATGARLDLLLIALLAVLTLIVFLPALQCQFLNFDDEGFVTANPHVIGGLSRDSIRWAFTNFEQGLYIPLTWLSFQLDAQLYHVDPLGFHLTNISLHVANVVLLYLLLHSMTGSEWRSGCRRGLFGSSLAC